MTRSKKTRKPRRGPAPDARTDVLVDESLRIALSSLLSRSNHQALGVVSEMPIRLRSEFDPTTVTMTSTNIPDAIIKLSDELSETNKASCRVFELIEREKRLLAETDSLVTEIGEGVGELARASNLLASYRAKRQEIATITNEILLAHEFQDLCGQNINKVMKLVSALDSELRELFRRLDCEIPSYNPNQESGESVNQSETDDILEEFGL